MSNKSVILKEPFKIVVENREIPDIIHDTDVILKVSISAICGSDLHIYRGETKQPGYDFCMGHELVGTVKSVGKSVKNFKEGDRVVAPFTISCGECYYCVRGWTGRCEKTELFGTSELPGGQAEWARVPLADACLHKVPADMKDENAILMCDIFPTGWYTARNAWNLLNEREQKAGPTAVVIGCGPVGLCGISSACERFSKVFAVDKVEARLEQAKAHGAIPVKLDENTVKFIEEQTGGHGPDAALEIVGGIDSLSLAIELVRLGGVVSSCGLHNFELKLDGLQLYCKNISFKFGRCPVGDVFEEALETLRVICQKSNVFDSFIQKRVKLDDATEYYKLFNERKIGKTIFTS